MRLAHVFEYGFCVWLSSGSGERDHGGHGSGGHSGACEMFFTPKNKYYGTVKDLKKRPCIVTNRYYILVTILFRREYHAEKHKCYFGAAL